MGYAEDLAAKRAELESLKNKNRDYRRAHETKLDVIGKGALNLASSGTVGLLKVVPGVKRKLEEFKEDHPKLALATGIAGDVATLAIPALGATKLVKGAGAMAKLARAGITGAKISAAHGVGNAIGDGKNIKDIVLSGAKEGAKGAILGGGLHVGGKVLQKGAGAVLKKVGEGKAGDIAKAARSLSKTLSAGDRHAALQKLEKKIGGVEKVSGGKSFLTTNDEKLKSMANALHHSDTEVRQMVTNRLQGMSKNMKQDFAKEIEKSFGSNKVYNRALERNTEAANKAYAKAYAGGHTINEKGFSNLTRKELDSLRKKGIAKAGSTEEMDLLKRNLAEKAGISGNKTVHGAKAAEAIHYGKEHQALSDALHKNNAYKTASDAAQRNIKQKQAYEAGKNYLKHDQGHFAKASKHEKIGAAKGMKEAIMGKAMDAKSGSNIYKTFGEDVHMERIKHAIGGERAQKLANTLEKKGTSYGNLKELKSGSPTAKNEADLNIMQEGYKWAKRFKKQALKLGDKALHKVIAPEDMSSKKKMMYIMHSGKLANSLSKLPTKSSRIVDSMKGVAAKRMTKIFPGD
jgi:hypothetical protein